MTQPQSPYTAAKDMREAAEKCAEETEWSEERSLRDDIVFAIRALPLPAAPSEPTAEDHSLTDRGRGATEEAIVALNDIIVRTTAERDDARADLARMKAAMEISVAAMKDAAQTLRNLPRDNALTAHAWKDAVELELVIAALKGTSP